MEIEQLSQRWQRIYSPKDRRPIHEYAFDKYETAPPLTITGPFRVDRSRHFIEPLNSIHNDRKREINVKAPVRSMKTGIGEVFVAWAADQYPAPIMWVTGKATLADLEWDRFEKQLEASPRLRYLLPQATPQGSRRNKQSGLVEFTNGAALYMHGNAELNLQQKGIRFGVHDEVWEWEPGKLDESYGRFGDYLRMGISKILNISQGGEDESDWDRVWRQGHCAEWEVQCQGCGKYFQANWSHERDDGQRAGMRWDKHKDENGFWIINKCLDSIRYECPHCLHPHTDPARVQKEWNRTGRYTPTNPDARPEKDSYHWTAVIDFPWRELVDLFLQAVNAWKQGNTEPLVKFFQKRMAENKSERAILESAINFARAVYDLRSKWDDELARFFTVDVQESVYWGTIRQWSKDGRSRRLWFGRLTSYADIESKRQEFLVKPRCVALDSGHRAKGDSGVYAACVRYGWFAFKGEQEKIYRHAEKQNGVDIIVEHSFSELGFGDPETAAAKGKAPLTRFSAETMADRLDGLITSGLWIEPPQSTAPIEIEYKRQMTAEFKKRKTDQYGRTFYRHEAQHKDNHAYDCAKMQVLYATLSGILPDKG